MLQYADNDPAAFEAMSWVSLAILDSRDRNGYRLLNDDLMVVWIWQKMQLMMLMLQPTDGQVCIPLHINCQLVFDVPFLFFSFLFSRVPIFNFFGNSLYCTDNIFTLRQWCSNNFPQAKEQLENLYKEVNHSLH